MKLNAKRAIKDTLNNIQRSPGHSVATIFVIAIAFSLINVFLFAVITVKHAIQYYEQRAEIIIYFKESTPEDEIQKTIETLKHDSNISSIKYVSQEEALKEYRQRFKDHPELVQTVTADMLPPNLEIRAASIDNLSEVLNKIEKLKSANAYIDDVWYFQNFVNTLKKLSKWIDVIAIITITIGVLVMLILINISISFNIVSHKQEIEVQSLMGALPIQIQAPFIISGIAYGIIGALLASLLYLVPIEIINFNYLRNDTSLLLKNTIDELRLGFLIQPNIHFILLFLLGEGLIGGIISGIASLHTIKKTLAKNVR